MNKPQSFNYCEYAELLNNMQKKNAYVEALKRENEQLRKECSSDGTYAQLKDFWYEESEKLRAENKTLRNELCQRCGRYIDAHNGSCGGCRLKMEGVNERKM